MNKITRIVVPEYEVKGPIKNNLSKDQIQNCHDTASGLVNAFRWEDTAEGVDFWNSVYMRLVAIADGEPLK